MERETRVVPKRGTSLAIWIIAIIVLGIVFWGVWYFLSGEHHPATRNAGAAMRSQVQGETILPVGGEMMDGVFHPETLYGDFPLYETAAFSSGPSAGTTASSSIRISSKPYSARKSLRLATT